MKGLPLLLPTSDIARALFGKSITTFKKNAREICGIVNSGKCADFPSEGNILTEELWGSRDKGCVPFINDTSPGQVLFLDK